jgi:hypothetical protein
MAACVHPDGWFAFQIGDGKCVTIHPTPSYTNLNNPTPSYTTLTSEPIPTDDRCFLNTTTSLCDPDATTEFRFCGGNAETTPVAIFLGTDGIDDAFPKDALDKVLALAAVAVENNVNGVHEFFSFYI